MAFLNLRKTKKEEKKPEKSPVKHLSITPVKEKTKSAVSFSREIKDVLKRPRVTEKASEASLRGIYVFEVASTATKKEIGEAVTALYKVVPAKIATASIPPKVIVVKGKRGVKKGSKKAYVYLKEGEKIEVI